MKQKYVSTLLGLLFFSALCWLPAETFAAGEVLKSAGCKTQYFLLKDLSEAYKKDSGHKVQLGKTGNKKAVYLLLDDKIDFAFTCKPIDKLSKKLQLDQKTVSNWKSIPIAKDPIIIVLNRKNGIGNITHEQLIDIFEGKITNWKEVGGNDLPVKTAYMNPELESGVTLLFKEFLAEHQGILHSEAKIGDGPSMLGHYVSVTPGGVTFMGFNSYREKYGDILSLEGVAPTRENILNGTYELSATYYLTLSGSENESVKNFVEYIRSPEGQKAIEVNFIPITE